MNKMLAAFMGISAAILAIVPLLLTIGWKRGRKKRAYKRSGLEEIGVKFGVVVKGVGIVALSLLIFISIGVIIIAGIAGWAHLIYWLIT